MASTYTTNLGLTLPTTGELAGTWGSTVNTGVTTLIDSAIAGTETLTTDADVTLTTTTGAANQARMAVLNCTGARTLLRNITAPAATKEYTVINATTGGFSVVIRGVGPTTGVTVLNGQKAHVAWNGTDFVQVSAAAGANSDITSLSAISLGTALLPSYSFTSDPNTGVWSPAADTWAVSTGGSERIRASSTGIAVTGVVSATKATVGEAITFTNAAASNKTGYLYTDAIYVGLMTGANLTGNGVYMSTNTNTVNLYI